MTERFRPLRLVAFAWVALLALAPAAQASTYCVAKPMCSGIPAPGVQQALTAASVNPGGDRVEIGPGTFVSAGGFGGGFKYISPDPVEIVGSGTQTVLTKPPDTAFGYVLNVETGPSRVADLLLRLPTGANSQYGLQLKGATAERVAVDTVPGAPVDGEGVRLTDATFRAGTVVMPNSTDDPNNINSNYTTGLLTFGGTGTVEDSSITAAEGLRAVANSTTLRRLRITAARGVITQDAPVSADNVLVRLTPRVISHAAFQLAADNDRVMSVSHATVIGSDPNAVGVGADGSEGGNATLRLRNSIISGVPVSLRRRANVGSSATVSAAYSNYNPATKVAIGPGSFAEGAGNLNRDPAFVDPAMNFRLRVGSPLIDAGDPAGLTSQESPADLDRLLRIADGNGDGFPRRDMGAYEAGSRPLMPGLDLTAPVLSRVRVVPKRLVLRGRATRTRRRGPRIRYRLSEAARVLFVIQRGRAGRRRGRRCVKPTPQLRRARRCTRYRTVTRFSARGQEGANSKRFRARTRRRRPLPSGRYRVLARATDASGNRSRRKSARFRLVRR